MDLEKLIKKIEKYNFQNVPCRLLKNKEYVSKFIESQERFHLGTKEEREKEAYNSLRKEHRAYVITQVHLENCEKCYNYYTKIAVQQIGNYKWNKICESEKQITVKILKKILNA